MERQCRGWSRRLLPEDVIHTSWSHVVTAAIMRCRSSVSRCLEHLSRAQGHTGHTAGVTAASKRVGSFLYELNTAALAVLPSGALTKQQKTRYGTNWCNALGSCRYFKRPTYLLPVGNSTCALN